MAFSLQINAQVAKCKNATVLINADLTLSYQVIDNGSTDACGILSYTLTPSFFSCVNGVHNVTLSVKDVNNNQSSCTGVVTIVCN